MGTTIPVENAEHRQVKRRRSTAEPELGPPRRRRVTKPVEEILAEDSEPDEPVVVPARKVGRPKKVSLTIP